MFLPDFSRIVTGFPPSTHRKGRWKSWSLAGCGAAIPHWGMGSHTEREDRCQRNPPKVVEISGDVNKGGSVIPPSIGVWMYIGTWGGPGWVRDCNYTLVSWFMTHLFRGRKQPTYKGVRIQWLSTMDIPVGGDFFFGFSPRNFGKWSMFDKHIFQIGCNHEVANLLSWICFRWFFYLVPYVPLVRNHHQNPESRPLLINRINLIQGIKHLMYYMLLVVLPWISLPRKKNRKGGFFQLGNPSPNFVPLCI